MTGRELILANINHEDSERPGLTFDGDRINDMLCCGLSSPLGYTQKRWIKDDMEHYDDEWGNIWRRVVGGSVKGEVWAPAVKDWSQLRDLVQPDYSDPSCISSMKELFAPPTDKFKLAVIGGWIFDNARYIRKMEDYFTDMVMYPEELKQLHAIVAGVYEQKIHAVGRLGADGIYIGEDMGTQNGLLFSPRMWREYFQKEYCRLFAIAHEYGMKIFMHSCGSNWEILPDLLEAGVDCFQFDQPTLYDMPALAAVLKKHKSALWSPVDIQKIMPTGDREIIESGAREMVRIFRGGLICKNYPDLPGIGVQPEWDEWAYNAILSESRSSQCPVA